MAYHVGYILLLITQVVPLIDGGAILRIEMGTFHSDGRDAANVCCDFFCNNPCDPMFQFCFDNPAEEHQNDINECQYGKFETGTFRSRNIVEFTENMVGVPNPLEVHIPKWLGSVRMKVTIIDDDHMNDDDFIDHINYEFKTSRPAPDFRTAQEKTRVIKGTRHQNPTSLSFSFKVYCEDTYDGPSCEGPRNPQDAASVPYTQVQDTFPLWVLAIIIFLVLVIIVLILAYVIHRRNKRKKALANASSSTDPPQAVSTGTDAYIVNPAYEEEARPQAASQTDPSVLPSLTDLPPKYDDSFYENFKNQQRTDRLPSRTTTGSQTAATGGVDMLAYGIELPKKC